MTTILKAALLLLATTLAGPAQAQSTPAPTPTHDVTPAVSSSSPPTGGGDRGEKAPNSASKLVPLPIQSTNAPAAKPTPDPRVRALLESARLKYKINAQTGDFELIVPLKEHRSQLVVISSVLVQVGSLELRRVWSPAAHADRPPSAELANSLLRDNFLKKLGYWAVLDSGNTYTLCFMAELAPQASLEPFLTTLAVVAGIADAKEKELTGKDVL